MKKTKKIKKTPKSSAQKKKKATKPYFGKLKAVDLHSVRVLAPPSSDM